MKKYKKFVSHSNTEIYLLFAFKKLGKLVIIKLEHENCIIFSNRLSPRVMSRVAVVNNSLIKIL